jgi:hypothetical protein
MPREILLSGRRKSNVFCEAQNPRRITWRCGAGLDRTSGTRDELFSRHRLQKSPPGFCAAAMRPLLRPGQVHSRSLAPRLDSRLSFLAAITGGDARVHRRHEAKRLSVADSNSAQPGPPSSSDVLRSDCSRPFSSWREYVRKTRATIRLRTVQLISEIVQNVERRKSLKEWLLRLDSNQQPSG